MKIERNKTMTKKTFDIKPCLYVIGGLIVIALTFVFVALMLAK